MTLITIFFYSTYLPLLIYLTFDLQAVASEPTLNASGLKNSELLSV